MIDNTLRNSPAYRVAYSMYVALGGDPMTEFSSVEEIYDSIDILFGKGNNRIIVETIALEIVENGDYNFDDDEVTGYKPVNIKVDVPQKYTDEEVEQIRQESYNAGYDAGDDIGYHNGVEMGRVLQKSALTELTISENGTYEREDGYKKVVVEVAGSGGGGNGFDFSVIGYDKTLENEINSVTSGHIAYSKTLYDAWDPSRTSAAWLYGTKPQLVYAPHINTSNVTDMNSMFYKCSSLTTIPLLDTSKVTNMSDMFNSCSSLTTIPLLDTSKVTNMYTIFYNCSNLTTIPLLDTSKVTNMNNMFSGCSRLESLPELDCSSVTTVATFFGYSNINTLTDIGGFLNLGMQSNLTGTSNTYFIGKAPNLTHDSLMNIINNLYDRATDGLSVLTLKLHANHLSLLTEDEIAIATNKGWTLS